MTHKVESAITAGMVGLSVISLFGVLPFILIWSVNTLFPVFDIQYNFYTWMATVILTVFFNVTKLGK